MDDTTAPAGDGWMLFDHGTRTGPYGLHELSDMLHKGTVSATAQVWQEGMPAWAVITSVVAYPARAAINPPSAPRIAYASSSRPQQPRQSMLGAYRHRVGHRSFIFQIWLLVWTASYVAFLFLQSASIASHLAPPAGAGQSGPSTPSDFDPLAALAGVSTAWVCLMVGWGCVGLPVGIAAVATMENNK